MQELSHTDLITRARNSEGTLVLYVVHSDREGESYCCNPTDDMRADMEAQAAEDAEREAEVEVEATSESDQTDSQPVASNTLDAALAQSANADPSVDAGGVGQSSAHDFPGQESPQ